MTGKFQPCHTIFCTCQIFLELPNCTGELFDILGEGTLDEDAVKDIAKQLIHALSYLHSSNVIHRDLKPQNILIASGGRIKICDFGFARTLSSQSMLMTSIKGTPLYMAPELVQEQPYTYAVSSFQTMQPSPAKLLMKFYRLHCCDQCSSGSWP